MHLTGGATVALGAPTTWSAGQIGFNSGGGTIQIGVGDVLDITGSGVVSLNFNGGLWINAGTVNPHERDERLDRRAVRERRHGERQRRHASFGQGDGAGSSSRRLTRGGRRGDAFTGGDVELAGAGARIGGAGRRASPPTRSRSPAGATFDPATLEIAGGTLALGGERDGADADRERRDAVGAGTLTVTGVASLNGLTLNGAATTSLTGSAQITGGST